MTPSKTEKLYLADPYTVSFRATVVRCEPADGGRRAVILDRSYFYPESGGQSADHGAIGPHRVVDVREDDEETVRHYVETGASDAVSLLEGAEVECRVDEVRRFDHMQQHTGQHVLSRAFIETAGLYTVSFHMGEQTCTIDLEGHGFDAEAASRAEELANRVVAENRPVEVRTVPVTDLRETDGIELRRAIPDGVSDARLVEVKDFDVIPCCGTHVRSTGELGLIKVLKSEKAKGLERVYFAVGGRALRDYREKHNIVQSLANQMTTSSADVLSKVDKMIAEEQRARRDLKKLSQALADYEAKALLDAAPSWKGIRFVTRFFDDRGDDYLRMISAALKREPAAVVIVGADSGSVVCSASDDVGVDFSRIAVEAARALGGSGGGKGAFAQLKIPAEAGIANFLEDITENVKNSLA